MFSRIKKYLIICIAFVSFVGFFSCKNQPIFAAIEQEVKLKKFSVLGNIIGFSVVGDKIYTANPEKIFYKNKASSGGWTAVSSPAGTELIQKIAADGTTLFISFVKGGVYSYNGSSWNKVPNSDSIQGIFGDSIVFGYDGISIYKIETSGVSKIMQSNKLLVGAGGSYFATTDALYLGGGSTAEKKSTLADVKSATGGFDKLGEKTIFVLGGNTLYHYDGSSLTSKSIDTSNAKDIYYFSGKNSVLVGCGKGYTEIKLSAENLIGAIEVKPGTSGSTTPDFVYNQYNSTIGSYQVSPVFAVSTKNNSYAIYGGILAGTSVKNTGLWGYYSDGKQEWNRE